MYCAIPNHFSPFFWRRNTITFLFIGSQIFDHMSIDAESIPLWIKSSNLFCRISNRCVFTCRIDVGSYFSWTDLVDGCNFLTNLKKNSRLVNWTCFGTIFAVSIQIYFLCGFLKKTISIGLWGGLNESSILITNQL